MLLVCHLVLASELAPSHLEAPRPLLVFAGRTRRSWRIPRSSTSRAPLHTSSPARWHTFVSTHASCVATSRPPLSTNRTPPSRQLTNSLASSLVSTHASCVATSRPPLFQPAGRRFSRPPVFNRSDATYQPSSSLEGSLARVLRSSTLEDGRHVPPAQQPAGALSRACGGAAALVTTRPRSPTRRTPPLVSVTTDGLPLARRRASHARRASLCVVATGTTHLRATSTGI